jgi:hypothetical protein
MCLTPDWLNVRPVPVSRPCLLRIAAICSSELCSARLRISSTVSSLVRWPLGAALVQRHPQLGACPQRTIKQRVTLARGAAAIGCCGRSIRLVHRPKTATAPDRLEDGVDRRGPDERSGVIVVSVEVFPDRGDAVRDAMQHAAADCLVGNYLNPFAGAGAEVEQDVDRRTTSSSTGWKRDRSSLTWIVGPLFRLDFWGYRAGKL